MGLDSALEELALVLFTTLAPSGACAIIFLAALLANNVLDEEDRRRVGVFMCIPLGVSIVGLVASAAHLSNPSNALYVFMRVGTSPLSNEVFAAVAFIAVSGFYWLYAFAEHPRLILQRVWAVFMMVFAAVFILFVGLAYGAETIPTWSTWHVPTSIALNSLIGGPLLASVSLYFAHLGQRNVRSPRFPIAVSVAALVANMGCYLLWWHTLQGVSNSLVSAAELVPCYPLMVVAFVVLCAAGIGMHAYGRMFCKPANPKYMVAGSVLIFFGIFIMRFAFYMMHMTVGLGV